ncbi:MAG TPA: acyl-CoA thioesterase domain-containing protein [Pseudonocardia sp.]|nr:acyl-CoA thioesterase domain-containing protein [Pseudonocardia sp.]
MSVLGGSDSVLAIPATTDYAGWWTAVLTLRALGSDRFEGAPAPSAFPRLYGGQVAAQCLLAAAMTVPAEREPRSVQVTYLRGGDVARPVRYEVEQVRESRTLSTRLVRAAQGDRLLATATASFHRAPPPDAPYALEHDAAEPDSSGGDLAGGHHAAGDHPARLRPPPPPGALPSRAALLGATFGERIPTTAAAVWPVDVRYVDRAPWDASGPASPRNRQWLRTAAELSDVPAAHAVALTFATDYPMFEPVLFPHALRWDEVISGTAVYGASLDHALWFHRPVRFDEWLLLDQVSPVAAAGRGMSRAEVRSPTAGLIATVVQEIALIDPR